MKCPKCQIENREEARFCDSCGQQFAANPPRKTPTPLSHEDQLSRIQKYLPRGLAEKVLAQRDKIEGERKQVTVLFCDMEGFTRFSEKLLPEEVYGIMDQVYEILMRQVHDFGGTVNEMTGDGIMALFGAPVALEEAPQRAIRAGLSIHRELAKLTDTLHKTRDDLPPIRMRIGIHTGPVVVGSLGDDLRVEFKAVGDTVVLAARLEQIAEAEQIYVSRNVFRATEGYFHFEALEPTRVKGKAEPVQVYRVTETKETPERSAEIGSPLVGREKELNRLELQIHRLIDGTGGIVTITGEAGIGKSRLMAELRRSEIANKVLLLEGRALSIGRSLSFYPIIDALKHLSSIREEDTDSEAQRKLEKAIRAIHPEEVNEVFPFIATLMGMKLTGKHAQRMKGIEGEALEKLIFKNVRELIIKGSEISPTVIYIEDFHWVDTSSLELIEALVRLVEEHRVLFVLVFRPGHTDTGDRIIKSIGENYPSRWTRIDLEPLNDAESDTLLSNLLQIKGLPHTLRDQILQRAGGNPFFLEEVVRSLIDEGAVILEKGEYQVTEKIKHVVIPQSINALLMTRIDRLDEATRNLVRVASVIGRNFFYRILTEVASNIEEIDRRLGYLKEIQLIRERKRMEELEYLFKHALAQEAAYQSILIQRRKELHNKVAQSIEKVFNERLHEFYGMLAYHYSLGEDLDRAEEYMIKAGQEAMKSAASSEALKYFEDALSIYRNKFREKASPEKIAMLEKNIAYALFNKGEHLKAADYFTKVLEYHGEKFPRTTVGIALKSVNGFLQLLTGLYLPRLKWKRIPDEKDKEIIELQFAKGKALSTSVPKRFMIETFFMMPRFTVVDISRIEKGFGTLAALAGLFSLTGISATISRKIVKFTKDKIGANDDESYYSWLLGEMAHKMFVGDYDLTHIDMDLFNTLTEKMLRVGAFYEVGNEVLLLGWFFIERGDFEKARYMTGLMGRIGAEYEHDHSKQFQLELGMRLSIEQGKLKEAFDTACRGIVLTERLGLRDVHFEYLSLKARAHMLLGDKEGAEMCFKYQEEMKSNTLLIPYYLSNYVAARSIYSVSCLEEAVKNGDNPRIHQLSKESRKWVMQAMKASRKFKRDRVEVLRLMGTRSWLIGEHKRALKSWGDSIETGERLKIKTDLSRTYFEVGKRLSEPNSPYKKINGIGASDYLNKARAMFEEMDLQWDLEQLEHVD